MGDQKDAIQALTPYAIIGFNGSVINGLNVHPDGQHIIYPMGDKVCVQNWLTKKMHFLSGHTNNIATIGLSPQGKYIGSGQISHLGFKAAVCLWDFEKKSKLASHELHKVRVEALIFTSNEQFMVSIGGTDDGHVVVWDCVNGNAVATVVACQATSGDPYAVTRLQLRSNSFITGGDINLRIWNLNRESKSVQANDVALSKLRRCIKCITVAPDDSYGIAGTTTGDLLKFSIRYPSDPKVSPDDCKPSLIGCFAKCGLWRKGHNRPDVVCYSQGVRCILILEDECLIVGAGDGTIDILDEINWKGSFGKGRITEPIFPQYRALRSLKLSGSITSVQLFPSLTKKSADRSLLIGTQSCEIYSVNIATFVATLVVTCHRAQICDLVFPKNMSSVFATGGEGDIRVWSTDTCQELLRIVVANFVCTALVFSRDGKSIVSAWNDGCIRAFTPLTGRLIYCILNTHNKGTSALDMTSDGKTIISGGCEGQVRVWDIRPTSQTLRAVLKEHKSPVSAIRVNPDDTEAVSAATDGSCIIWDLIGLTRRQVMYANTLFSSVCYDPTGCQILTAGTDRRVAYWEAGTGALARELEASKEGSVNGVDISPNGELFISGGNDQILKLWKYMEGIYTHMGVGHAGAVSSCRFSPDSRRLVSACSAGTIIVWNVPEEYLPASALVPPLKSLTSPKALSITSKVTSPKPQKSPTPSKLSVVSKGKEEKIAAMDTARESIHSTCDCGDSAKSKDCRKGRQKVCVPKECLPTRTTSKATISMDGSGDKK